MIGMIAAVSLNSVIGKDNTLPFNYPEDMKHFKKITANSNVIMGRKTYESVGLPLPKRKNIVVSSTKIDADVITVASLSEAINISDQDKNIWLIGGASIYSDGMLFANEIHLTLIPDIIEGDNLIRFPFINPLLFEIYSVSNIESSNLNYIIYKRKH